MPLFAALPPADLPTMAYVPTALHVAEPATVRTENRHTVRSGDTVYDIAARYGVSPTLVVHANNLTDGGRWILPGTTLVIPAAKGSSAGAGGSGPSSSSSSKSGGARITVRAGDTLSHLAVRHGTTVGALASANDLRDTRLIYPGQVLVLPGSEGAGRTGTGSTGPSTRAPQTPAPSSGGSVTVRAGDTLSGIAARHGVGVAALAKASGVSTGAFIHPGQVLRLPGGSGSPSAGGGAGSGTAAPGSLARPYDPSTVGDLKKGEKVDDTFLHYRYSDGVARSAAANREYLAAVDVPSREAMRQMVVDTSRRYGVDPQLMVSLSYLESGWNMRAVSPANAIGAMQVIPTSGEWASSLVGRDLNLLDPQDNVTAGVVIMRALLQAADREDHAIGGYYQGLGSVRQHGLFADTTQYVRNVRHLMSTL